jgi:hypothetical protein
MPFRFLALALAAPLLLASCSDGSPATGSADTPSHAGAAAAPGSHEDWCGEHAVPESMCTRCDPGLSAAFKATGDWCAEHGLPESQCRKCDPDLEIVRPPAAGG